MPGLILPSQWRQQPQQAVPVDRGNPLAQGLLSAIPLSISGYDAIDPGHKPTLIGTPPQRATARGIGPGLDGSTQNVSLGKVFTPTSGTILLLSDFVAAPSGSACVATQSSDPSGSAVGLGWQGTSFFVNGGSVDNTSIGTGIHCLVGTWSPTEIRSYLDGVFKGTNTGRAAAGDPAYTFQIGAFKYNGGTIFRQQNTPLCFAVWNYALSPASVAAVSANPWQLFKTPSRRIWVASAGGGVGASFAASVSSIATVTAALTTAIRLAAAPVGQASVAASLTTAIRLTANPSAQASSTAQLSTAIPLTAAAGAQASITASLTTAIRLTSSATAGATSSGSLTTAIKLAASVTGTASVTANMTAPTSGLSANVVASSSVSAQLTTAIALGAMAQASATSSASLTTAIRLTAAVIAQASATATLTAPTLGLSASIGASASVQAILTTQIALAAAAVSSATAVATLSTTVLTPSECNTYVGKERNLVLIGRQRTLVLN